MPSIISGYNYDIFVSYRQKDNKGDMWVSEFVEALKTELESTFKEEISVYFDVNPHDGLLETHDVNESLKEKLKCLVFIPIISRTYCDTRSFAWEYEFKKFLEQASKDQYGLKVKLPNGNVASRVLPVIIHELDTEDNNQCESVLGGVLRGIEFIYKEPGVNKPLTTDDDEKKNLNGTKYKIQINKTTNAIKEILSGLKLLQSVALEEKIAEDSSLDKNADQKEPDLITPGDETKAAKRKKWIYALTSSVTMLALAFALFLFSGGSTLPFTERDWIIVTDFENLTGNTVFDNSLYTALTLSTSQSRYINIFPRSRMFETLARMEIKDQALIDENKGREIAVREGIDLLVVPSINEVGNIYAIGVKIINSNSGKNLKSEVLYAETQEQILPALDKISKRLRRMLGESRFKIAQQDKKLVEVTTSSLEALKQYSIGCEELALNQQYSNAKEHFEAALSIDTGFTAAIASLGVLNIEQFNPETGRKLLDKAVRSVDKLTEKERLNVLAIHALDVEGNISKAFEYIHKLTLLYPDDLVYHNNLGLIYMRLGKFEEALDEFKTAIKIRPDLGVAYQAAIWIYLQNKVNIDSALVWTNKFIANNPENAWAQLYLGLAYISIDSIPKAEKAFERAREFDPYLTMNLYELAHIYRIQGRYMGAIRILSEILAINKNDPPVYYNLGLNYQLAGDTTEADKYYSIYKDMISESINKWPNNAGLYISSGIVSARLGDFNASEQMLQKAASIDSTLHKQFSEVLCLQGKTLEALSELEKALDNGYRELFWLKLNPDWQSLQYDTRFVNLLKKYFM